MELVNRWRKVGQLVLQPAESFQLFGLNFINLPGSKKYYYTTADADLKANEYPRGLLESILTLQKVYHTWRVRRDWHPTLLSVWWTLTGGVLPRVPV